MAKTASLDFAKTNSSPGTIIHFKIDPSPPLVVFGVGILDSQFNFVELANSNDCRMSGGKFAFSSHKIIWHKLFEVTIKTMNSISLFFLNLDIISSNLQS